MDAFEQYKRKGVAEMRPYVLGEDLSNISVAAVDNPVEDVGMIARNPNNHADQWYVARKYFEDNFERRTTMTEEKTERAEQESKQASVADRVMSEAMAEAQAAILDKYKTRLKRLLESRAATQEILRNIDREIADLKLEIDQNVD